MLVLLLACGKPSVETDVDETDETADTDDTDDTDVADVDVDDPEAVAAVLAAAEGALEGSQASGAQIAVWRDGVVTYIGSVGFADPDGTRPIDEDTLFQVGSDTKKMTAIAVLQAVERGDLSLDDPLSVAVPELTFTAANAPADVTLHELMSHQSGLYDYTPWDDDPDDAALASRAYGTFAANEYAMAPAGAVWNYSNPNFALAGLAAEIAADRPWADIVEDDLFAPLGMTRSFARRSEVDGDAATGRGIKTFDPDDPFDVFAGSSYSMGSVAPAEQVDNAFIRPAGLVWSTASDMCRLAGFLVDGDAAVLRDDLRAEIYAPHVPLYPSWPIQSYGYGLFVLDEFTLGDQHYEAPFWAHGGNTLTMTSLFYVLPESRFAVCILSNGYGDELGAGAVEAMERWGRLPAPSGSGSPPPPLDDPSAYAGTYVDPRLGRIEVTAEDGDLGFAMPDLAARGVKVGRKLTPVYQDLYLARIDGADYDLTFVDGYVRNRLFVGTKGATAVSLDVDEGPAGYPVVLPDIPTSMRQLLGR